MSALLSLGEANHAILLADAEIKAVTMGAGNASLRRALDQLDEARATLGAVRLALRSHALADALAYHDEMAVRTREAARRARMVPGRGLYLQADAHETRAKALRVIIGTAAPLTAIVSESGERSGG